MKIERLSENQIRCTLNKADLAEKELMLSELAYGSEKAKELFRELMQQASSELGFEVDNIPLMIEAIPVSSECLILIITKVEDPDELDTRFSRFTKHIADVEYDSDDSDDDDDDDDIMLEHHDAGDAAAKATDGLIEALGSLAQGLSALSSGKKLKSKQSEEQPQEVIRVYSFITLKDVMAAADTVKGMYDGNNSLFKNESDGRFFLYMAKEDMPDGEFARVCNMISEYGDKVKTSYASLDYFEEHFKLITEGDALQTLGSI